MCRISLLLRLGGVYADTDVEPTVPLRLLLPPEATAVIIPSPSPQFFIPGGSAQTNWRQFWRTHRTREIPTGFHTLGVHSLPVAAGHPFVAEHLNSIIDAVLHQQLDRGPLAAACNSSGPASFISGPIAWTNSWLRAARGCAPQPTGQRGLARFVPCAGIRTRNQASHSNQAINRTSSAMRRIQSTIHARTRKQADRKHARTRTTGTRNRRSTRLRPRGGRPSTGCTSANVARPFWRLLWTWRARPRGATQRIRCLLASSSNCRV